MIKFLLLLSVISIQALASDNRIFLGFGELPIVSSSFKPAIGYSLKISGLEYGIYLQQADSLKRDDESYNADFGQGGLVSSSEKTSYRGMLQSKYFPFNEMLYLSLGVVFGGADSEKISFGKRERSIGSGNYNTSINLVLEREASIEPALGFGLAYVITGSVSFVTDFTMAWLGAVPNPVVSISTSDSVLIGDQNELIKHIRSNYRSNFHNRYHLFNIGLQYSF